MINSHGSLTYRTPANLRHRAILMTLHGAGMRRLPGNPVLSFGPGCLAGRERSILMRSLRLLFVTALLVLGNSSLRAQAPDPVPLKNWPAPLYWQAAPSEEARNARRVGLEANTNITSPKLASATTPALVFVGMTPCRIMDTRIGQGQTGAFGPPTMTAGSTRTVPIPTSPTCNVPSAALAYSLNVTVVPPGAMWFLSIWPTGQAQPQVSTLNDGGGQIMANAAVVEAGTSGSINIYVTNATDVILDINGYYASLSDLNSNTAVGTGALRNNTTGYNNTANGVGSLANNTTGYRNTASGTGALQSNTTGNFNTANGDSALQSNTTGEGNTAIGAYALASNTTGGGNTANGGSALSANTTGSGNTANGSYALGANTTGDNNTAIGRQALWTNSTGYQNTASGISALSRNTTGCQNMASGAFALEQNTTGCFNTASGDNALNNNTAGGHNIAIGFAAGTSVSGGNNYNIHIGSQGYAADSGAIRIGTPNTQTSFFAAGIRGVTTANNDAIPVVIDSAGQLGTVSSSRRFKEDIQDMGDASHGLMQLRPVTFRYQKPFADGSMPTQYGLIAEEVAEVYPDLVAHSADGQIETVKYQVLDTMLLNEVQKLHRTIEGLEARLAELENGEK